MFKEEISSKNVILIENLNNIELFTYESELKQVIINLLKNAKDFTNEGLIIVSIYEKKEHIIIPDYAIGKFQSKQTYYKI